MSICEVIVCDTCGSYICHKKDEECHTNTRVIGSEKHECEICQMAEEIKNEVDKEILVSILENRNFFEKDKL